jgi:hypothetical protein
MNANVEKLLQVEPPPVAYRVTLELTAQETSDFQRLCYMVGYSPLDKLHAVAAAAGGIVPPVILRDMQTLAKNLHRLPLPLVYILHDPRSKA